MATLESKLLKNLTKRFDELTAVNDLSFEVKEGGNIWDG